MSDSVRSVVSRLEGGLVPLRIEAERLIGPDAVMDPPSGAALISHRPKIAPGAYACVIFPGVTAEKITRYEQIQHNVGNRTFEIPAAYREALMNLNGGWIFQLALYGLPPSMCSIPQQLDRSKRQPLDIGLANQDWCRKYSPLPSQFHFGSGPYSWEENLGYFLEPNSRVIALRQGGLRVSEWPSIAAFMDAEISRARSEYREFEARMGAVIQAASNGASKSKSKKRTR